MYKVEGYEFETKEQADLASEEAQKIRYLKSKTDMRDPDVVLKLYNKLILREEFVTPIGRNFLRSLQGYLHSIPYIKREDILPITVSDQKTSAVHRADRNYRRLFHISTFFAVVFALGIIGMFLITYVSADNVNIINYENALIDKYEKWEQELEDREMALNEREAALEQQKGTAEDGKEDR